MITNVPTLDWITATTRDFNEFTKVMTDYLRIHSECDTKKEKRRIGVMWEGQAVDNGAFFGVKSDLSDRLYICVLSGDIADSATGRIICDSEDWHKTRVDVQLTVEGTFSADKMRNELESRYQAMGRRARITCIYAGNEKEGTVNVGSRTSPSYTRLYVKQGGDGKLFSRWEVELKTTAVNQFLVWSQDYGFDNAKSQVIMQNINKFDTKGRTNNMYLCQLFLSMLNNPKMATMRSVRYVDENKTLRWLAAQVFPSVSRLSTSHSPDVRRRLRMVIVEMLERCDNWD